MRTSDKTDQLELALARFQGECPVIPKNSKNPHFNSRYADLPTIRQVTLPILLRCGLVLRSHPDLIGEQAVLTTRLSHPESGQWEESSFPLRPAKSDPQGLAGAITYARRYAESAILGIVTEEDDDGNLASGLTRKPAKKKPPSEQAAELAKRLKEAKSADELAAARKAVAAAKGKLTSEELEMLGRERDAAEARLG